MYKIAGYITFYKDIESLDRCIKSIKAQSYSVDHLIIVDNSPSPLLHNYCHDRSITIISRSNNIGVAGGLKIGIEWAIKNNYDFLWTFDQDSEPSPEILEKLIDTYERLAVVHPNIGIIAPLPRDKITGQLWHGIIFDRYRFIEKPSRDRTTDFYSCDAVITSGSLVSIELAKQIDLPNEALFIDAVDWEYCLKFRQQNYSIMVAQNIILEHRFGDSKQINFFPFKQKITIYNYSPLRYYYRCRNHTYVETRLAIKNNQLILSSLQRLKDLSILIAKIILFERQSTGLKIWACLKGTSDGFRGKLGKTWLELSN